MRIERLVQNLCAEYHFEVKERLTAGNICEVVYRVVEESGRQLVLKVGADKRTIAEIQMNLAGYQKLRDCGLANLPPAVVAAKVKHGWAFILMEYCGPDFVAQARTVSNPLQLYSRLIAEMERVYRQSLQESGASLKMVDIVAKKAAEQYKRYLRSLDPMGTVAPQLDALVALMGELDLRLSCFSSWDFTPEDVYLTPRGIKYGDPHEEILGIPVIDLACFGGVVRDAYQLPGSKRGYQMLRTFASGSVAPLLEISDEVAEKVFLLGRVLQCFLSARFRIASEPGRANDLFSQGKRYLTEIVG